MNTPLHNYRVVEATLCDSDFSILSKADLEMLLEVAWSLLTPDQQARIKLEKAEVTCIQN